MSVVVSSYLPPSLTLEGYEHFQGRSGSRLGASTASSGCTKRGLIAGAIVQPKRSPGKNFTKQDKMSYCKHPRQVEGDMKRVTGIGGIFFKAETPEALYQWYEKHLESARARWVGCDFRMGRVDTRR